MQQQKTQPNLIYSLLFSLALALIVEHQVFSDPMAINDDVRNQIYWMAKFINPNYFANDYIASYLTQPSLISPVFSVIYRLGSYFADPKQISQLLPFPIILVTTYFLFKFSELHRDSRYAFWVCFCFNLYIWAMKFIAGGLPRSSFYLLFFMFLYLLSSRKSGWLLACLILQALTYPTACFMSMLILLAYSIRHKLNRLQTIVSIAAGCIALYSRYLLNRDHSFGALINFQDILKLPECFLDGRRCVIMLPYSFTQIFKTSPQLLEFLGLQLPLIVGVIIFITITMYLFNSYLQSKDLKQAELLWISVYVSIALFIFAHFVLLYMYLPHRYIAYTLPLVPIFLLGTWFYYIEPRRGVKILSCIVLITILVIGSRINDDLIQPSKLERQTLAYLSSTSIDSLVVAPPRFASNIPAYSYRSVLVSSEVDIPFHKIYYTKILERIADQNSAYRNPTKLKSFINKYGVDYIVLDRRETSNIPTTHCITYSNKRFKVLDAKCL